MERNLDAIIDYMQTHWPSRVRAEWQVPLTDYPAIVRQVVAEWSASASRGRELVRIAGLSGSGKTTQLLPAVEAYYASHAKAPVLIAARRFVTYHPHYDAILATYGESKLRAMTDEFSTIMMFFVLAELTKLGCDIILDVTLLDPQVEGILLEMLVNGDYDFWMTMIAVAPEVTEQFLGRRAWRHTRATELEFMRATRLALDYYATHASTMRILLWDVWHTAPIYDGAVSGCLATYDTTIQVTSIPAHDEALLREQKITFLTTQQD